MKPAGQLTCNILSLHKSIRSESIRVPSDFTVGDLVAYYYPLNVSFIPCGSNEILSREKQLGTLKNEHGVVTLNACLGN